MGECNLKETGQLIKGYRETHLKLKALSALNNKKMCDQLKIIVDKEFEKAGLHKLNDAFKK